MYNRIIIEVKKVLTSIKSKYIVGNRNEREFAYEFYHLLRKLKLPKNVEVTAETTKVVFSETNVIMNNTFVIKYFDKELYSRVIRGNVYRYPDLIIHEYKNKKQQLAIFEIKKRPNITKIKKDIAKLIVYCKGRLKYQKGILILINPRLNIIEIPSITKILTEFPEIEIWVLVPNKEINIISKETLVG